MFHGKVSNNWLREAMQELNNAGQELPDNTRYPSGAQRGNDKDKPRIDLIEPGYLETVVMGYEDFLYSYGTKFLRVSGESMKRYFVDMTYARIEEYVAFASRRSNTLRCTGYLKDAAAAIWIAEYPDDLPYNDIYFEDTGELGRTALNTEGLTRFGLWLGAGAIRYEQDNNWKLGDTDNAGIPESRYYGSLLRHMNSYAADMTDEDHFSAVNFNLMGLWFLAVNHYERHDDDLDLNKVRKV